MTLTNIQKRFLLFLIGCIGIRLLLVYISKTISIKYLPYLGYIAFLPMIGFIYLYVSGSRKTGAEVFGDKIWWNNLRPIHALFYGIFAYNAIHKNKDSWVFLLIDVIIGIIAFLGHHYMANNLDKIFTYRF
tara:strand:+ start:804 stop:1196 length:393 start_codon:yes stop_codon:yes gene_type:complete